MTKLFRLARTVAHAAALVFCAFWLVATSSNGGPEVCYTGIPDPVTLQVTLGTPPVYDAGPAGCQGIDGLLLNGSLTFSLANLQTQGECDWYQTVSMNGASGVTLTPVDQVNSGYALTEAAGTFSSTQSSGCQGSWRAFLAPTTKPDPGVPVSPLDAGGAAPWTLLREIDLAQAELCGSAFATTGPLKCADTFPVTGITQAAP